MKQITFFNKKGGTGKTSLAFSIAKDMNYPLLSNDDSVIEDIYPKKAKIMPEIKAINHHCIYDLGGYIEVGIIEIFKNSTMIIVVTALDINAIKRTINTVVELNKYCENIVIVINRVKQTKIEKYKQSIKVLEDLGKKIIMIRESEAITNSMHTAKSISELYAENNFSMHQYKGIYADYRQLLDLVKGEK